MESTAKTITQCDNCKAALKGKDDKNQSIKAILNDPYNPTKTVNTHYCDEECLRQHLNSRSKKKRSKASIIGNTLEIEVIMEKSDKKMDKKC